MIINATSYYPGGSNYNALQTQFGFPAANQVYAAALTGDNARFNETLSAIRSLARGGDSNIEVQEINAQNASYDRRNFGGVLYDQVTENPLDAPFEAANKVIKNTVISAIGNPFFAVTGLAVVAGLAAAAYFYFGGKFPTK